MDSIAENYGVKMLIFLKSEIVFDQKTLDVISS